MRSKRELLALALKRTGTLEWLGRWRRSRPNRQMASFAYHRIADISIDDPFCDSLIDASPAMLRSHFESFARWSTTIGIAELEQCHKKPLPPGAVLLTFDDAYRSCVDVVLPRLKALGLRAVFFIPTRFIEERRLFWWDRASYLIKSSELSSFDLEYPRRLRIESAQRKAGVTEVLEILENDVGLDRERFLVELAERGGVPWNRRVEERLADRLLMTWGDVVRLRDAGMDIGSHSCTHPRLDHLGTDDVERELLDSRAALERVLGGPVRSIAYPHGHPVAGRAELRYALERAGYTLGFTFGGGLNPIKTVDPFDLNRIPVNRLHSLALFQMQIVLPSTAYVSPRVANRRVLFPAIQVNVAQQSVNQVVA